MNISVWFQNFFPPYNHFISWEEVQLPEMIVVIKYPTKADPGRRSFFWLTVWRHSPSWRWELEAAGHIVLPGKRERWTLLAFSLVCGLWPQPMEWHYPHLKSGFSHMNSSSKETPSQVCPRNCLPGHSRSCQTIFITTASSLRGQQCSCIVY